jgi:glycosyltransferase involved in cell wall biosynthesis
MRPLVSVIMPVFNGALTIADALASVRAQQDCSFEVIVCDDGSTDTTLSVLQSLDNTGLKVISQTNRGPSAARNHALQHATGDYIACLDADDLWLPGKLHAQAQALNASPEAAVAYGWTDIVDARNNFAHRDQRATYSGDVYSQLLSANFIISGSNSMMRRAALLDAGAYDESLRAVEDWELHVRLAAQHPFVHVPQIVVHYRKSLDSLSSDIALMESSYLAAAQKVFASAPYPYRTLEKKSTASFYRYLATRSLQSTAGPGRVTSMLRYLGASLRSDPGSVLQVLRMLNPKGALSLAAPTRLKPSPSKSSPSSSSKPP